MAEKISDGIGSFVVRNIQYYHHMKIDVVKFDETNNFGLWRCDALNAQNLENALELQKRPEEMEEKVWKKINRTVCGVIWLCLS